jgi:hypothetical protein
MSTLHSSLYAVALLSCLLLLLIGRETLRHMRPRARYLLALLGLTALNFAFEWLMANPSTPAKSLWLTLVMGMAFLFGPCLWLYARSIDEPATPRLRDLPRSHLVVLGFGLLLLFPLLERTHLGTESCASALGPRHHARGSSGLRAAGWLVPPRERGHSQTAYPRREGAGVRPRRSRAQ